MLKRKLNITFWASIATIGCTSVFFPTVAHTDTTSVQVAALNSALAIQNAVPPQPAPASAPAQAPAVITAAAAAPVSAPQNQAQLPPPDGSYLSYQQASAEIGGLNVHLSGTCSGSDTSECDTAVLTGAVPNTCSQFLNIDVQTGNPAGFAIQTLQGWNNCVTAHKNDAAKDSLSQLPGNKLVAQGTGAAGLLNISYLDHVVADVDDPQYTADGFSDKLTSAAQQQADYNSAVAAANAQHQQNIENQIMACAQSATELSRARNMLIADQSILSPDMINAINTQLNSTQQTADANALKSLENSVQNAINSGSSSQFDDLENQIYTYAQAHPDADGSTTIADALGGLIFKMEQARTNASNATTADITTARTALEKAIDPDAGLGMSDTAAAPFKQALAKGGGLDQGQLVILNQNAMQDLQSCYTPQQPSSIGILTTYSPISSGCSRYSSDMQAYNKQAQTVEQSLLSQYKSMGCENTNQNSSNSNSSNVGQQCNAIASQIQNVTTGIPQQGMQQMEQNVEQARMQQMQQQQLQQQMQQQLMSMNNPMSSQCSAYPTMQGCSSTMGMPNFGQAPVMGAPQTPGMPNFGSPSSMSPMTSTMPNFSSPMATTAANPFQYRVGSYY